MKSHGKARECRPLAVYRYHAFGVPGAGDGVLGLGGDGPGTVRIAVRISVEAIDLGGGGTRRYGGRHARGLPAIQASGAGVFADGIHDAVVDLCLLSRPLAQHASLDSCWRILVPAL